ncbi:CinY protein [Streptomyces sp. NBC_00124]|uniref:CinY protein n=1 Tax=Streptomyces sp. NBC_00124 TaxID=2975662 RepID=UPI0022522F11|nr:CinY protein [Streptomyces sp. NBC_00124]MCX5357698.1 CinY protein [Streptomyces sp. NBC_00124]
MAVIPPSRTRSAAVAALLAAALSAVPGGPAHAFTGGNHEDITRAALPWEPVTLTAMADARDGAVNANDHRPYFDVGPLHCDNADYLDPRYAPGYPRTRDEATTELLACIRTSVARFRDAVRAADGLVDADGTVRADQSDLSSPCTWDGKAGRAKCAVLEQLGRGWHQIEDFYSHSNWSDRAAPGPIGLDNPPGLERTDLAPFLDIRRYSAMDDADWTRDARARIPSDLATGCYPDLDSTGVKPADCEGRVSHNRALNKDTPASARSKTGDNFRRASAGATAEVTRQWNDFKAELLAAYPDHGRGAQMICALVHDDPATACPS